MSETRKVVKVFLASPSDLSEERKAAKAVVDEVNTLYASEFGYQVELVGWEDTVSVIGRPQETINKELAQCEFFVGILWRRWGTPPDKRGRFTSGFEEEFRRSVERHAGEKRPEISLFFKEVPSDSLRDPGQELSKVLAFKQELIDGKENSLREFPRSWRLPNKAPPLHHRLREAPASQGTRGLCESQTNTHNRRPR